jgi:hypothetical protein
MRKQETRIKALSDEIQQGRKPALSPLDALALLQQTLQAEVVEVPEGWLNTRQYSEAWGKSYSHTARLLEISVERGLAEKRKFGYQAPSRGHYYRFHAPELSTKA